MTKCARCPNTATLESLLAGPEGCGLVTEWLCLGCAREKSGKSREMPPEEVKRKKSMKKDKTVATVAAVEPADLFSEVP